MYKIKKTIENIAKFFGYKYVRYAIPYRIKCRKHKGEINYLKSILEDDLSIKILDAAIKCRKTRNYKYLLPFYDNNFEKELSFVASNPLTIDTTQYFPQGIITTTPDEVFVDGGGFIGDMVINFVEKTGGYFKKIYVFEPISEIYEQAVKNTAHLQDKVVLHNAGLYSEHTKTIFEDSGSGSRAAKEGKEFVTLVKFDEYIPEEERSQITYIKLDIEGSEMKALEGMKETIMKYKPKLAICIYHKPADLWELPLYIHQLNPDYKLYIRQHHPINETVLYAI
jgi:FkbM family methyltransferase